MNLESQVCSLDLAKRLKELGMKQESLYFWIDYGYGKPSLRDVTATQMINEDGDAEDCFSAFTVAEIGEMLPNGFWCHKNTVDSWIVQGEFAQENTATFEEKKEADVRARMLCHLIEKGLMKP